MPTTTGFTTAQLARLEQSIALGILTVEHNGKRTTFQSLKDMLALRDRMKSELAAAAADPTATPSYMTRPAVFLRR